jgi:TPR repeat protein
MDMLGETLIEGDELPRDTPQGLKWVRAAADCGNSRALECWGMCLEYGTGMAVDRKKALHFYAEASQAGSYAAYGHMKRLAEELRFDPAQYARDYGARFGSQDLQTLSLATP